MKAKYHFYTAGAGLTTLIAILLSVRDQLIQVGPWVLGALIASCSAALLYGGFRGYVAARKHWLEMKAKEYAVRGQQQTLRLEQERWDVERAALLLGQHLQVARIYPDQRGYMPTLVSITDMGSQYISLPHPVHQTRIGSAGQQPALPERAESLTIPAKIRYEEVASQIPAGHALLGISAQGVETCDFRDLMTMLICGGSSTGKSNTVAIKLHEAMRIGYQTHMLVIDPHKNKPDSLYNKIRQYEPRFLLPVAQKDEQILQSLNWFKQEFERRMELSTEELEALPDILLICDEVYGLVNHRDNEQIGKLIKQVSGIAGYESRGYGMYAWFLTQKVTGLKWLRDAVMTTICHKMQTMAERVLASNDDREIARDMDNWTMPGRVVVFGLNLPVTVTQMPLMVVDSAPPAMEPLQPLPNSTIIDFQAQQWKRNPMTPEIAQEKGGKNTDELTAENAVVLKNLLSDIREKRAQGMALNTILREYGVNGGRAHQEVKQLIEEMDA